MKVTGSELFTVLVDGTCVALDGTDAGGTAGRSPRAVPWDDVPIYPQVRSGTGALPLHTPGYAIIE